MAQMPPPGFPPQGGFDPFPQFDVNGHDSDDDRFRGDLDHGVGRSNSNKKDKDGKKKKAVEVQYEGFMLEKAAPEQIGEKPTWSRAGRRALPFSDAKLAEICKKVRLEYRVGPLYVLTRLSGDQQGVITRLIALRQQDEKNKDAEWVLECVRRYTEKHWRTRTKETVKIMVILKRQDRNSTKSSQRVSTKGLNQYQQSEIIDLTDPVPKDKKNKKKDRDQRDPWDDGPVMPDPFADVGHGPVRHQNVPIVEVGPPPPPHGHGQQNQIGGAPYQGHFQDQHPPQGAIPINQFPPQQQHGPMPHDDNPFQPNPPFNIPGAFDMPPTLDGRQNQFQTRNMTPIGERRYSRSRSREEEEHRQQRRDSLRLERKVDRLERLEDHMNQVINKVEDWNLRENSSSNGSYRDRAEDFWSAPSGGSFTPPSTPPLSPLMMDGGPNGSLGRRGAKAYYSRDDGYARDGGRYYPRDDRRRSAGQVVLEPYNSHSHRRIDYGGNGRRRSDLNGLGLRYPNSPNGGSSPRRQAGRPMLHHGNTWNGRDDYPAGPYAERDGGGRRAITQFPGEDYGVAEFGGSGRRRRDAGRGGGGGYYEERRGGRRRERDYVY